MINEKIQRCANSWKNIYVYVACKCVWGTKVCDAINALPYIYFGLSLSSPTIMVDLHLKPQAPARFLFSALGAPQQYACVGVSLRYRSTGSEIHFNPQPMGNES